MHRRSRDSKTDRRAARACTGPARRLELGTFARQEIEAESLLLDVPVAELASFAVLYYLADLHSGRIARRPRAGHAGGEA